MISTPSFRSKRIENKDSSKYTYINFHSSTIHIIQKIETA